MRQAGEGNQYGEGRALRKTFHQLQKGGEGYGREGGERNLLMQKTHQWYGNLAEQQELKLEEFEYTKG